MPAVRPHEAAVLRLHTGRYWHGFTRTGALQTAWCMAGAKMFQPDQPGIDAIKTRIEAKGYGVEIVRIGRIPDIAEGGRA